ncbi:MAG: hypothetical protein AB1505_30885 [Candidatus Latescibacterota bacterium]
MDAWLTDLRPAARGEARCRSYRLHGRQGYVLRLPEGEETYHLASPVRGWHEIHLGLPRASGIQIRLAGEPAFRWVESLVRWDPCQPGAEEAEEAFWKVGLLRPEGFELRPQVLPRRWDARSSQLAYLRLVPLTDAEAQVRLHQQRVRPTRTAGAVIDGHEMLGAYGPRSAEELRGLLEPFADSDFGRIHFGCTCTTMRLLYLSRLGHYLGQGQPLASLHSDVNRRCARCLQEADRQGWDPIDVLIAGGAALGLEVWADFRIQQDYPLDYPGGFGQDFSSPFALQHPEWRHVDRHGQVCSHLFSHFHPGWEEHKLGLLGELAAKGPAGVHLNLMCEVNAIWDFAPEAVARFRQRYGMDPTATAEPPEEWYQFRCDHLTGFMRRLRQQTEAIARQLGRRIRIAVQVSGEWSILQQGRLAKAVPQNLLAGFDVGRWAREGLVDVVSPSFRRTYRPMFLEHLAEDLGAARAQVEVVPSIGQHDNAVFPRGYEWSRYFTDEGAGARDLVPFGELDAWRVLREAQDLYSQGADGVEVWEMGHAPVRLDRWNVLRRIGDRELLRHQFGTRVSGLLARPSHPLRLEVAPPDRGP